MSDFGLGGGLALRHISNGGNNGSTSNVDLELGGQIRAFVSDNLSLSAALGLAVISGNGDVVDLGGDLEGTVGVHYYFF